MWRIDGKGMRSGSGRPFRLAQESRAEPRWSGRLQSESGQSQQDLLMMGHELGEDDRGQGGCQGLGPDYLEELRYHFPR